MITKEEIIDILKMYSGYVDRSCSDKAVHEDNFDAVAYEIESKLHQPTVSGDCEHPYHAVSRDKMTELAKCSKCGKEWY